MFRLIKRKTKSGRSHSLLNTFYLSADINFIWPTDVCFPGLTEFASFLMNWWDKSGNITKLSNYVIKKKKIRRKGYVCCHLYQKYSRLEWCSLIKYIEVAHANSSHSAQISFDLYLNVPDFTFQKLLFTPFIKYDLWKPVYYKIIATQLTSTAYCTYFKNPFL